MDKKSYTILFVPQGRSKVREFEVSRTGFWTAIGILTAVLVGLVTMTVLYVARPVTPSQMSAIENENRQLEEVNRQLEADLSTLTTRIDRYEERSRKLAIVAGIEELTVESGVGGQLLDDSSLDSRLDRLSGGLDRVERRLSERIAWASSMPSIRPTSGILTSRYGARRDPITSRQAVHQGVDISAPMSAAVVATADGLVVRAEWLGELGKAVQIAHGFGHATRYGHLSRIAVRPGDHVSRGETIGFVGSSGRSTGAHLHYEVFEDGEPVDPLPYLAP